MSAVPSAIENVDSSPKRERFYANLHRSYYISSGVRHFIARRVRPAGIALGLIFVLSVCMGVGHERTAIYQILSFGFSVGLLSVTLIGFRQASLQVQRELPRYGTAGKVLRYSVAVTNVGKRSLSRAWLIETVPDTRPSVVDFSVLREPGEEERNAFDRYFAYFRWQWLMLRNRLFEASLASAELKIKPKEKAQVYLEITPLRRGLIRLSDLRVILPDPFGVIQKCVRVEAAPATLLILPRRYPLPVMELPGGVAFKISGETNTNALGNSGEFVGLRDYRPQDPMRQIHWKSWARTGRPIVKELEDTHYPRYGLVLDCLSVDRTDVCFEEAVSVAASFACSIDTSESLLDLMFVKDEAHQVTVGRGLERADKLLEVLAGVTPERTGDLKSLARLVLEHRDDLTSCVVILNGWDDLRADFLQMLELGGVIIVPIIIGEGLKPAGLPGYWLESGRVARDLMLLPQRFS